MASLKAVPRFSGKEEEYETWSHQFIAFTQVHHDGEAEDTILEALYSTNPLLQEEFPEEAVELEEFGPLCKKLFNYLILAVPPVLSARIRASTNNERDGYAAWRLLRNQYAGTTEARVMSLHTKLQQLKKTSDETIDDYLSRADLLRLQIESLDPNGVSSINLRGSILNGLPEDYRVVATIIRSSTTALTADNVRVMLRNHEDALSKSATTTTASSSPSMTSYSSVGNTQHALFSNSTKKDSNVCSSCHQPLPPTANVPSRWCEYHKTASHSTSECRMVKKQASNGTEGDKKDAQMAFTASTLGNNNKGSGIGSTTTPFTFAI